MKQKNTSLPQSGHGSQAPQAQEGCNRPIRLERQDLIIFEPRLRSALAPFIPHTACSLHFPGGTGRCVPEYIGAERKLLLPLWEPEEDACVFHHGGNAGQGRLLGLFVARGVKASHIRPLMRILPQVAALAMQNLLLYKTSLCDGTTGLFTRLYFFESLAAETVAIRENLHPQTVSGSNEPRLTGKIQEASSSCVPPRLGVLVVRLHALRGIVREHGYMFADGIMRSVAESLRGLCPAHALIARAGDFEFALTLPGAGGKVCAALAETLAEQLSAIRPAHALTRKRMHIAPAVGYALYPQDMGGRFLMTPPDEQARLLFRNARMAAALAAELPHPETGLCVMGFGSILAEGGQVLRNMPLSRVGVSLGSSVNAREGQRFSVWSGAGGALSGNEQAGGAYKGEIVLMEVHQDSSIAEIVHLGDPAWELEPGDRLALLPGGAVPSVGREGGGAARDSLTGFLHHGDFLARWTAEREKYDAFALGIIRFAPAEEIFYVAGENGKTDENATSIAARPDKLMGEAAGLCREFFGQDLLGGRYGLASLILFHPGMERDKAAGLYSELCRMLSERLFPGGNGSAVAAGVACWPYLGFRKSDTLDNCKKALEYALLLPPPHAGCFDSLALTISADKRFSLGDHFAAIEEYKTALLADEGNTLAWNSLGVCLASLGRHEEARRYFTEALERQTGQPLANAGSEEDLFLLHCHEQDSMILYNLGYSSQCLGEMREAKKYYKRCLRLETGHMYALIRMGQIAETEKKPARARKFYVQAGEQPGGAALSLRHLATLSLAGKNMQEARELLHEALSLDPQNAVAQQMLAGIYLEGGEDPGVAEALARQSVALRPGLKSGWLVLARALEAQGRSKESREALLKAGEL